jgi:hypothetical protein
MISVGVEYPALPSTVECVGVVGFILRLKAQVFSLILYNTLHRFPSYQTGALQTNMQRVAMTESPFPVTQIESLVRDTRRARLADEDLTEDDVADMRNSQLLGEPPLIGDCAANAVALCKTLDDEYFNPILV